MSTPEEHLKFQWAEVHKLDDQLAMMRRWGVSETDPGYLALWEARGAAYIKVGTMKPRTFFQIARAFGMSPGVIALWSDAEIGWVVEARVKPGAPPVYKHVSDEVAEKIVKKELTPELVKFLMTPDPYIGE